MDCHTNIWHQRLVAILGSRNLYLRTVYAHIANYTVARGAWCGNVPKMAKELELPEQTVRDQLKIVINQGIVIQKGNQYTATVLPNTALVPSSTAAVPKSTPPVPKNTALVENPTPINKINMNETNLTHAPIVRDENQVESSEFKSFVEAFNKACNGHADWQNRAGACEISLWNPMPQVKRKAILRALADNPCAEPNPYFYLLHFPDPQPEFLSGKQQEQNWKDGIPMVQVLYNGLYLICTKQTQLDFNLDFQQPWLKKED